LVNFLQKFSKRVKNRSHLVKVGREHQGFAGLFVIFGGFGGLQPGDSANCPVIQPTIGRTARSFSHPVHFRHILNERIREQDRQRDHQPVYTEGFHERKA